MLVVTTVLAILSNGLLACHRHLMLPSYLLLQRHAPLQQFLVIRSDRSSELLELVFKMTVRLVTVLQYTRLFVLELLKGGFFLLQPSELSFENCNFVFLFPRKGIRTKDN